MSEAKSYLSTNSQGASVRAKMRSSSELEVSGLRLQA